MPSQQATLHTPERVLPEQWVILSQFSESEVSLSTKQILYPEGFQDQIFTSKCKNSEILHILLAKIIELNSNMITREHLLY